jgi:hypothetical protein
MTGDRTEGGVAALKRIVESAIGALAILPPRAPAASNSRNYSKPRKFFEDIEVKLTTGPLNIPRLTLDRSTRMLHGAQHAMPINGRLDISHCESPPATGRCLRAKAKPLCSYGSFSRGAISNGRDIPRTTPPRDKRWRQIRQRSRLWDAEHFLIGKSFHAHDMRRAEEAQRTKTELRGAVRAKVRAARRWKKNG